MAVDTGNGATVGLTAPSGISTCLTSVTLPNFSVDDIETSCLNTTNFKTFIASDLTDPGEIVIEFLWDPTSDTLLARGTPGVMTITWAKSVTASTTNSTFIADGYIRELQLPTLQNGELQTASLTWKLNGEDTEPALVLES